MLANDHKPVVALDIDGTLGDYHSHFTRFAEAWTGRDYTIHLQLLEDPTYSTGGVHISQWLGMGKKTYRECKLAYRQGGMKRSMPAYPWADGLTRRLRSRGIAVWICTTRPYLRLDNIDPDTRHWLRRNKIQYDGVVFEPLSGRDKYGELVRQIGSERILLAVDDLPEQYDRATKHGLTVVLRDQPYNRYVDPGYKRITNLRQIPAVIQHILDGGVINA